MKRHKLIGSILVLIAIGIGISIFIFIFKGQSTTVYNRPMIISNGRLYYSSDGKFAYYIGLGNAEGNSLGIHNHVSLMSETNKGIFIMTCPKNSFTDKLIADNLKYNGDVTLKKLGVNSKLLKELS